MSSTKQVLLSTLLAKAGHVTFHWDRAEEASTVSTTNHYGDKTLNIKGLDICLRDGNVEMTQGGSEYFMVADQVVEYFVPAAQVKMQDAHGDEYTLTIEATSPVEI